MEYRAVGRRCAVDLKSLKLPIPEGKALSILDQKGFRVVEADVTALARECIGVSRYRRSARPSEAPETVDCSSLVKWAYGERGIWLPRRSIQQREMGSIVDHAHMRDGDVVFVSGKIDYYNRNPECGVGHVGIATAHGTVIHAMSKEVGVTETLFQEFVSPSKFRGIRRYINANADVLTLETPPEREVETSDDIKWIIMQSL